MKNNFLQNKGGFTLVELMVATTIFMIVIVMGLSSLISINSVSKRSQSLRAGMDNLNFAIENMSRTIRLGYDYGCINDFSTPIFNKNCGTGSSASYPISGSSGIMFKIFNQSYTTPADDEYTYFLNQASGYNSINRCIKYGGGTNSGSTLCAPITAPEINIVMLRFVVSGATLADGVQPGAFMYVEGTTTVSNTQTPFKIQTFISQRQYEK